jgi:hypothetical protein
VDVDVDLDADLGVAAVEDVDVDLSLPLFLEVLLVDSVPTIAGCEIEFDGLFCSSRARCEAFPYCFFIDACCTTLFAPLGVFCIPPASTFIAVAAANSR